MNVTSQLVKNLEQNQSKKKSELGKGLALGGGTTQGKPARYGCC